MTTFLRLTLVCALVAACGDDQETTETDANGTTTGQQTTTGQTTDEPTTDATTSDGTTTDATTTTTTTTDATTTTTTDATTTVGTDPTMTTDATTGTSTTDGTTDGTTGGVALSWEKDVYPAIVAGTCGCHGGGSGGLTMTNAMDSYANIVDVDATQVAFKRVAPGDPANSYFLAKVAGTAAMAPFNSGSPAQMPKGGAPKGQTEIDLLTQWIAEGANP